MMVIAILAALLALLPLALAARNLNLFKAPRVPAPRDTSVSILIPARDEASTIGGAIDAALASTGCEVEVVVLDDQSTDGTAKVVQEFMQRDARVRLEHAPPLSPGWAGKQRACWLLAKHARFGVLMFIDADVRLAPEAAALAAGFLLRDGFGAPAHQGNARLGLVSGFPLEETKSIGEHLVIPWIHVSAARISSHRPHAALFIECIWRRLRSIDDRAPRRLFRDRRTRSHTVVAARRHQPATHLSRQPLDD